MADFIALAPLWYVAFLFSTVCHEAAHALVAKWGGDHTAYVGGQVTLDPVPHVKREPFGLVVMPLLTLFLFQGRGMFGWGSAPFDPFWQIRYPRRAALMALAGPVSNFILAIIAGILMHVGLGIGIFDLSPSTLVTSPHGGLLEGLATFLHVLFVLNVILGVFNLLPVPPLDGYSVLGLFLPEDIFLKFLDFARSPGFSLVGMLLAYKLAPLVIGPVLQKAMWVFFLFM